MTLSYCLCAWTDEDTLIYTFTYAFTHIQKKERTVTLWFLGIFLAAEHLHLKEEDLVLEILFPIYTNILIP